MISTQIKTRHFFCMLAILTSILVYVVGSKHTIDLATIFKKAVKRTRNAIVSSSVLTSTTGFPRHQISKNEVAVFSKAITSYDEERSDKSINSMISSLLKRPPASIFKDMTIKPPSDDGSHSPSSSSSSSSSSNRRRSANSFIKDAVQMIGPSVARIDCEREIPGGIGVFGEHFR